MHPRSLLLGLFSLAALAAPASARPRPPLVDAPAIWWDDDRTDLTAPPAYYEPHLLRYQIHETLDRPLARHATPSNLVKTVRAWGGGDRWGEAQNVNALDEVPNSSWFTNRIGLFPMTMEELARGAGEGAGPDRGAPWTIVKAKTEGVTPGFNVKDAAGQVWVVKFDPPGCLGMTTAAGAISERLLYGAGYNTPCDDAVAFRREDLVLGDGVRLKDGAVDRAMTEADLDAILGRLEKDANGRYLAIASKFLAGKPVGPFDYQGLRDDDPNDRVRHEYRRELRGLRVFCAWITHFDTKEHNTLDMFVEEDGRHFVKHHLIDFASTLGAGAAGLVQKDGWEYGVNATRILGRLVTLGLVEDDWRKQRRPPGLPEVGYFGSDPFDPMGFEPLVPNPAFARLTDRDGYWAAKIISAFDDEALHAICAAGKYRDPRATDYVAATLGQRRDLIARRWFQRICPVDFFRVEAGKLVATDLGVARGLWKAESTRYRFRTYAVDAQRRPSGERPAWTDLASLSIPIPGGDAAHPFQAFELRASRDDGDWTPPVVAYVARASGRVVAVDR
ncbi:MAG: hypothetical protein U0167_07420 [bacterium]